MSKVLLEITEEHLETGLRGYPVGYCETSSVDPQKGLIYSGFAVSELVNLKPEDVIYLLYYGKKGSREEVEAFSKNLRGRDKLSNETIQYIEALPKKAHPMKLFSLALLILGSLEGTGDYREDCLNLIAKLPELAAVVINYHAGWGKTPEPRKDLGYMENFTYMLNVPCKDKEKLGSIFRLFNILHYDHGGGNLSTFVGKAVASGLEDMYGSICSAMCALAGPRHGKANQDCLHFVEEVITALGENPEKDQLDAFIRKRLESKKLIFGFGHAVLRVEDPRATVFYEIAAKEYPNHPLAKMALLLRDVGPKVLKENPKVSDPYPNVDAISGVVLSAAGFPYPEYFTVLFGLARAVGISIQIVYERCEARDGKGTPIVRPKYLFKPRVK